VRLPSAILNLLTLLTLAVTGCLVLVFALLFLAPGIVPSFLRQPTQPAQVAAVTPFHTPTAGVKFPTLPPEWTATPSPQPTATSTTALTETPSATLAASGTAAASSTPAPSATLAGTAQPSPTPTLAGNVVKITTLANVRSGPDTDYPILTGLPAGATAAVLGRDSSSQWFKISVPSISQGAGWVSIHVASYAGNLNDLPILTAPPPPARTPTVTAGPPTATSVPNVGGANGLLTLSFSMRKTTGAVGDDMWFDFKVHNSTNTSINNYGILAAHTDQGVTADSWHGPLDAGQTLTWNDHINFPNTGTYQVYLGICYASHDACKTGGAAWTRLSPSTAVTIH
jgi:hypothetical protein